MDDKYTAYGILKARQIKRIGELDMVKSPETSSNQTDAIDDRHSLATPEEHGQLIVQQAYEARAGVDTFTDCSHDTQLRLARCAEWVDTLGIAEQAAPYKFGDSHMTSSLYND